MPKVTNASSRMHQIPVRNTRSRSSSFSSVTEELTLEPLTLNAPASISQSSNNNDSTTIACFIKCLQISGVKNNLASLKSDINQCKASNVQVEQRLTKIEEKLDAIMTLLSSSGAHVPSASLELPSVDENMIPFTPGGPYYNDLAVCEALFLKKY